MSITTFSELKTAIASWAHRSDLTTQIPDAITFAEAKFNRRLRVRQMETAMSATAISSGLITRPTGLIAVKALWNTDDCKSRVEAKSLDFVMNERVTGSTTAYYYAWDRTYFRFDVDSGEIEGTYYAGIDALSDGAPTNWLLTANPDLYLSAALAEIYLLIHEEDRATLWESKTNARIEEMNMQDQRDRFSGNPLAARVVR
jgi:hypothetical protein